MALRLYIQRFSIPDFRGKDVSMEQNLQNAERNDPLESRETASDTKSAVDLPRIYKTHIQGAIVRSGGSLLILMFALGGYAAGHLKGNNIAGIGAATAYLLLMNPPVLWLIRRSKTKPAIFLGSVAVNLLEIAGYTAIIYYMGGLRALWLSPIYVVLIIYVGIWGPPRQPFIVATLCGLSAGTMVWLEYSGILPCQDPFPNLRMPGDAQAAMMMTAASYLYVAAAVAAYMGNLIHRNRRELQRRTRDLEEKTAKLEAAHAELETTQRSLEERVRNRTQELAASNRQLDGEISRRSQLMEKLHRSEALLTETQQLTRLGGWSYDVRTGEITWTEEVYRIHEMPVDPGMGLITRSLACYHEEDRPLVERAFRRAVENGEPYDLEVRFTTAKGRPLWVRTIGRAYMEEGQVVRVSGNFMDITDRKRSEEELKDSEERYRFLAENMGDIVWTVDRNLRITYVSPSIEKILGFTPEERKMQPLEKMLTPESHRQLIDRFHKELSQESLQGVDPERTVIMEVQYLHKNGSNVWLETTAKALRNSDGGIVGIYGVSRDISDRKRAEENRLVLERQLQQAHKDESLGRMAGAVAHHFNNMLFGVMGNLELALDDIARGTVQQNNLEEAMTCAQQAAEISGLMLTYLGQGTGNRNPIDLSRICRDGLKLLAATLPKTIRLKEQLPEQGPLILADEVQIRQVVTNLVVNASEAIGEAAGDITLVMKTQPASRLGEYTFFPAEWKPSSAAYASLSVSDTSFGMTREIVEKIFDPFFSTKFTGRGLGLPVALGVAKAHGGAFSVKSEPGKGTTITAFLPVMEQQPMSWERTTPGSPESEANRILLVDDEVEVRRTAAALLERLGHEVVTASDGVEALSVFSLQFQEIRCVILDLSMPRMGGWETLKALRNIRADLPVVMASGYEEVQAMKGQSTERPDAFLHKPYRREQLREAIMKAMRNPKKT